MGQRVLEIVNLTHGYGDRRLFDDVSLEMEKGERVALIGESPCQDCLGIGPSHHVRWEVLMEELHWVLACHWGGIQLLA